MAIPAPTPAPMPAPIQTPIATYRLQFNAGFTFEAAAAIVGYLSDLGISHVYASSYLKAVPGSLHGYDVVDPTRLNPEIGTEATYLAWVASLRARGMGHIIDFVPNHMGIAHSANPWWQDVLENGESSRYADVFDIDWHPIKPELEHKVLLPVLGDAYGAVLERQEIRLVYERGAFDIQYFDHCFPIAPGTYDLILGVGAEALLAIVGADSDEGREYQSILAAIRHLPSRTSLADDERAERDREKQIIKRRLATLTSESAGVRSHIEQTVATLNGVAQQSRSFDRLDALLSAQAYRLADWRVAAEEINYRRFFDIDELAAIRMEDPTVFERTHAFVFDLVARGCIDGFRIDHVDGLYDPGDYLQRLRARTTGIRPDLFTSDRPMYLIVEKVLGLDETLPDWRVDGTTGYDFLAMVNGVFVDGQNERAMNAVYERYTRLKEPFAEIAYRGKQLVLRVSMASELNVLAHRLNRFSEHNRRFRDFTLNSLTQAMREIIACFPVYRTYVNAREPEVSDRDRIYIEGAVREAKRRNRNRPPAVYNFVRDLLLKRVDALADLDANEHMQLVGKFQQLTSPVTARGIEDTALYIYNRLASLNEVGGEPEQFGIDPARLHRWLEARVVRYPHALSATSTHDTKRSEDVRARINVLSELPGAWKQAIIRWARLNRRAQTTIDGHAYPSRNEEYLLYQTLIGSWPVDPLTPAGETAYRDRILAYMQKAIREAKVFTSWINPNEEYEAAMARFVTLILAPENVTFRQDFVAFQRQIARYGSYNSLSQLAIKITAPGIPDFYQGTECWDFTLVDPDNRRPVDFLHRRALLTGIDAAVQREGQAAVAARLASTPEDAGLKLFATAMLLRFRRQRHALFASGTYQPLYAEGARRHHVFAFARHDGSPHEPDQHVLVMVPRLVAALTPDASVPPLGERVWADTAFPLPEGSSTTAYRHVLTGARIETRTRDGRSMLMLADAFETFPVAVLEAL